MPLHLHKLLAQPGERGASAVEYALLVSLIAAVIFGVVVAFGGDVVSLFASVDF